MAGNNLTTKSALTGAATATGDLYHVVDVSTTTDNASGSDRKQTAAELMAVYPAVITTAFTGSGAHATEDKLVYYDNAVPKTILVTELTAAQIALAAALTGSGVVPGTDTVCVSDGGVGKKMTFTEFMSALTLAGFTLADIPSYADQAAAATALSGTGQLFRFATTGALGITIT